ncbi:MAG: TlpA disulfide reductase family protein [Actinomycetota bacterium]|nr:TlpA disulfide reductase family protein [Actinomycetota bacterium]
MQTEAAATAAPPPKRTAKGLSHKGLALLMAAAVAALSFAVVAAITASRTGGTSGGGGTGGGGSSSSGGGAGQQPATLVTYKAAAAEPAPALRLPRLGGGATVTLTGLGKRPIVVNFFASWCTACQAELKAVAQVADEGRVSFVGVDTNETSYGAALKMLQRVGARYPVGIGGTTQADEYRAPGLPTTVFINAKGRVVAMALGAVTRPQLDAWVVELLSHGHLTS